MNIQLQKSILNKQTSITITGSKSESNRLLILQALYPKIEIKNLSNSDDTQAMIDALKTESNLVDVHHAGTTMRFLTALFSTQEGKEITLTGSQRMKERPIEVLVEALNTLGADVKYLETSGYPPLKIIGKSITKNRVTLNANVSSQYISALLLIASKLDNGLELTLDGKITSVPYINMTLHLLNQIGVKTNFIGNVIRVNKLKDDNLTAKTITVESDWSSASYFYSMIALSDIGTEINLSAYKKESLQGDSSLVEIYKHFGVSTRFEGTTITLQKKSNGNQKTQFNWDLSNSPDIAQTIAVTCFALGIACNLTGLHTLKIKETDRLVALKTELEKFGAKVEISENSLFLHATNSVKKNSSVATYNDHRMAMAFAPLALKTDLKIEDAMVVSKSYPTYWKDLKTLGFQIK